MSFLEFTYIREYCSIDKSTVDTYVLVELHDIYYVLNVNKGMILRLKRNIPLSNYVLNVTVWNIL